VLRSRRSNTGSRSVDLAEELPSPLMCAPARRPAHLLGYLASPRLGCLLPRLPASGHHLLAGHLASPVSCVPQLHALVLVRLFGAPPTGGTHSASQTRRTEAKSHRMDDRRGSAKHLWETTGVSTHRQATAWDTPVALCGGAAERWSLAPCVARVWPRLPGGGAYRKSRNLGISGPQGFYFYLDLDGPLEA
jgi:hypothetical protein